MISGYCVKCGFPAVHRCQKCDARLCNNCVGSHECAAQKPELELSNTQSQSETVKAAIRKPYAPRVKK